MSQMNDGQLVQRRTASMAKDMDFNIPCRHVYNSSSQEIVTSMMVVPNLRDATKFYIPTQEVLRKWLRDVHGIYIELIIDGWGDDKKIQAPTYRAFIWTVGKPRPLPHEDIGCADYEYILEEAIEFSLYELLPKKNRHIKDLDYNR